MRRGYYWILWQLAAVAAGVWAGIWAFDALTT